MNKYQVYQIFYDQATKESLDKGFLPLDNSLNQRPDWSEYWPIRKFLLTKPLDEDCYYGFLSPKFLEKTTLTSQNVYDFIADAKTDEDIVTFSPCFDQIGFYVNIFEQATINHLGIEDTILDTFRMFDPKIDPKHLVSHALNTVFCNYFVAKPRFWREWLRHCEVIFWMTEENQTPLAQKLNESVSHVDKNYPAKVFIMERVVNYLLATQKQWKIKSYNTIKLPRTPAIISRLLPELVLLDSLKIAYDLSGKKEEYIQLFFKMRQTLLEKNAHLADAHLKKNKKTP